MPLSFEVTSNIRVAEWLRNPRLLWNKGLLFAGQAWETEARQYPPPPSGGTGTRTGNLGKSTTFRIIREGELMHLIGPRYYAYLLIGTGVHGPRGAPIMGSPFMVWRVTNMSHPQAGMLIKARSIQGTIWRGKREKVIKALRDGFIEGIQRARGK